MAKAGTRSRKAPSRKLGMKAAPTRSGRSGRKLTVSKARLYLSKGPVQIQRLPTAEGFPHRKKIHARQAIPKLRFGGVVGDAHPNPALALDGLRTEGALADAAAAGINVRQNIQLDAVATADTASHVCEPSVARNGDQIFMTGNWFASPVCQPV